MKRSSASAPAATRPAAVTAALAAALLAIPASATARSIVRSAPTPARSRAKATRERTSRSLLGPEFRLVDEIVAAAVLPRPVRSPLATVAVVRAVGDVARAAKLLARPAAAARLLPILTVRPVDGAVTSPFGYRRDPFTGRRRWHAGVDLSAHRGEKVRAAGSGVVVRARWVRGYGRVVIIDHGFSIRTRYAHLHRYRVRRGAHVRAGQVIGTAGSSGRATGPHVHFEVRAGGRPINPEAVLHCSGAPSRSPGAAAGIATASR